MRLVRTGALVAAGVVAGRALARKVTARQGAGTEEDAASSRWLAVTVNAPLNEVQEDSRVAEVLEPLGVERRLTPAPGGRGTEIAARVPGASNGVLSRVTGDDPRQGVRRALRDLKSAIETGEVVRPDEATTGKSTPGGALVRLATRRAGGEGRL